ncbi:hypothetical protein NHN26_04000 [Rhodovulum tesquicola]|uniref:Uncharacterized protein n=1 Tax=Rhodovulum steppense TaxID=540251 RepID=A0A4R1YQU5_9RHOB|nr:MULTISPECIES: hypothetical protein [Rhodovulum]MCO8144383.1 hypothetical protein [Rhodovulum tesquicola]TCM81488.1 hypothetical protein EV216_11831 [Rhodovulum steppense]
MGKRFLLMALLAVPAIPAEAAPTMLDCTADLACVTRVDSVCDPVDLGYAMEVPRKTGDKLILTTAEGERFFEFRRLDDAPGVLVQAAGGALEPGQGAGAMTVFDDLGFVLTRHSLLPLDGAESPSSAVAITIHGRCEARR